MTLPFGHRIDKQFVCMDCITPEDHRPGGIGGASAVHAHWGHGKHCARCHRTMPHTATARLAPDGISMITAPRDLARGGSKSLDVTREATVLVDDHVQATLRIAGGPEVGIRLHTDGRVDVWVHDHHAPEDAEPHHWTHHPSPKTPPAGP